MMTFSSSLFLTIIMTLAAMAFFTLLERKYLGYSQTRKGPNKVSLLGTPQPLADAMKLFSKHTSYPSMINTSPFLIAPMFNLTLALLLWVMTPSTSPSIFLPYSILMFLCISSLSVYTTMGSGWASNSKYALLGALRSVAQTISYEVSMSLILISTLIFASSLNLQSHLTNLFSMILICPILSFIWFTTLLAETNRTPFDFAEGESELVSGFNTEYSATTFAFIFMAEYTNIIFMSMISALILFSNSLHPMISFQMLMLKTTFLAGIFICIRATLPRMRYDRLMNLTWMAYLPLSLVLIMLWLPFASLHLPYLLLTIHETIYTAPF